ncbi:hypothetical protein [Agromyces mariniharenae]|uniref:hypothetical protein n=1 Tax=Agromyces mariniharenae TaxID=2604423 RepID=UPI00308358EA
MELNNASGTYIDPSQSRITIGVLGSTWLAFQTHLKPSSVAVVESAWRLHVEPAWGRIAVADVRHSDVQDWVARLGEGVPGSMKPKSAALCIGATESWPGFSTPRFEIAVFRPIQREASGYHER